VFEFAASLIVLVPLLLGTWEVGRLVQVQQMLNNAVREGGRQAATGARTTSQVQQDVVTYLTNNGIPATTSMVTVTNLTSSSRADPTQANLLDQYQVSITIPFDSVRWILLNKITGQANLSASATWSSMADTPLSVNTTIPTY
jgi:Flp pilus assembly protein TadG